ncbi:MAG: DnaT-like ssDNA-binding protein [Luminiphilus sp.]
MAISINATAGEATANSYLTLADAQAIIDGLIEDDDVTAWASATTDQKNRALYTAAQRIDRERFLGARATDTQAMQWPRTGVRKPDTYINTYAVGFPFRITTDYFTDTEIPDQVKKAQAVLAAYLNNNKDGLGLSGLEDYKTVVVGSISVTPDKTGAVGADRIPPIVERYFTGLRISGPGNIAVKRS